MGESLLRDLGLVTAWHLTDIGNLESIGRHGLLSRNQLNSQALMFAEVGWTPIVATRWVGQEFVLSFVDPRNKFVYGRHTWHTHFHPNSKGLCLIEIDLHSAIGTRENDVRISSGNIAKQNIQSDVRPVADFEQVLLWNALLEKGNQEDDVVANARMAEILLPSPVAANSIRNVWVKTVAEVALASSGVDYAPVRHCERLFEKDFLLYPYGVENFSDRISYKPFEIEHSRYGIGQVIGALGRGQRAIARFSDGLQVISFGSYRRTGR